MVVCNNDLIRLDGLIDYAVDRFPEIMFLIIRCNNDADAWSRHVENQATGLAGLASKRNLFISEFIAESLDRPGKPIRYQLSRCLIVKNSVGLPPNSILS